MIYIEVTESVFMDVLDRHPHTESWSYEAMRVLFNELEIREEDFELNPVDIDMQWTEYTQEEFVEEYREYVDDDDIEECIDEDGEEDFEAILELVKDEIDHRTTVLCADNGNLVVEHNFC